MAATELIRRVKKYTMSGMHCAVVRYAGDNRYTDRQELISSHDREFLVAISATDPWDLLALLERADVVALDEAQFMTRVDELCEYLANAGKIVLVAGLDSDFRREPFPLLVQLVPKSERITKLDAICFCCHGSASFSRRIDASNTAVQDIGGAEKYVACCRPCFSAPIDARHLLRNRENAERLRLLQSK